MACYHQLGHQSDNLIEEEHLSKFVGAIISPVNYTPSMVREKILLRNTPNENFQFILDPQLYFPRSQINKLTTWDYFPTEYDTQSDQDINWWGRVISQIFQNVNSLNIPTFCTPNAVPRIYSPEYYRQNNEIAKIALDLIGEQDRLLHSTLLPLNNLADEEFVGRITSIITQSELKKIYLIFINNNNPRRELKETEELKGALQTINLLKENGYEVLVGFCSSNLILWKIAGATDCATGKFFNLRNFTPSRWLTESGGGGGQLEYLFEESLISYLRESDIPRVDDLGLISKTSKTNPYYQNIQQAIHEGNAWVKLSWCFYMYWFSDIEARLTKGITDSVTLLEQADRNWEIIEEKPIYLEERQNKGDWIRPWLRAITE